MPGTDQDKALYQGEQTYDVAFGGGGGGGAPTDAAYVVISLNGTLTNERTLAVGSPLTLADGGAGNSVTLDFDETVTLGNNARVAVSEEGSLIGTRRGINFVAGSGIAFTISDNSGSERVDVEIEAMVGGTGTVTSVALTMPGIFSVAGSPITTAGTFDVTLATQTANTIFAGPTTGSAAAPTFRAMVAADIPVNIVGLTKIQQITTDRVLGRDTAGTGDVEQITVGGGLEFTGSGGIQRSALTGDVTASAGSGTTAIGADKVLDTMLRNGTACSVIGRAANSSGDPGDISASANDTLLARSGNALAFQVTTTGMYGDATVTLPKMANLATQRIIGRATGSTGVPEAITASQVIDFIGSTRGSLIYRGSGGWAAVTPGTAGHVLTSNGAGADPSYQAPATASDSRIITLILEDDESHSSNVLSSIVDFELLLDADSWYRLEYTILFQIDTDVQGIALSVLATGTNGSPQALWAETRVPISEDVTPKFRSQTTIIETGALTTSGSVPAANTTYMAHVTAYIHTHATIPDPCLIRYHSLGNALVTVKAGTSVVATKIA